MTPPGRQPVARARSGVTRQNDDATSVVIKLTIAYDGTRYQGWQIQKTGTGVQQIIETALHQLFPTPKHLHGASRTDTGVHALGMIAHVIFSKKEWTLSPRRLPLALNAHLPPDIRVRAAEEVAPGFHARFQATGKEYRYYVWNAPAGNPLLRHCTWHVPVRLDVTAMRQAARLFLGRRDFRSLATTRHGQTQDTVRTLTRCSVHRSGPLLTFVIQGDGFLYNMCRSIAGTLVLVGKGKIPSKGVVEILNRKDRRCAGMTAPARGLVLHQVFYP